MDQEKLKSVLNDKSFAEKIVKLQTPEEVQAAFKEKGVELSVDDVKKLGAVINKMVEKGTAEISEEDLRHIAGGYSSRRGPSQGEEFAIAALGSVLIPTSMLVGGPLGAKAGALAYVGALIVAGAALGHAVPWAYNKLTDPPTADLIDLSGLGYTRTQ